MPLPAHPTRTEKTKQHYRRRCGNLVNQCRRQLGLAAHDPLDYRRFVGWLIGRKPDISRDTWRQYKASAVFVLEGVAGDDAVAMEALETLLPVDVSGCVRKTRKTSGTKMKKVPARDFRKLVGHLREHATPWSADLDRWVCSSLLTGLRPGEWAGARLTRSGAEPTLVVINAKASNGRTFGETRTIFLGGLSDDEVTMIEAHVARANEWEQAQQYDRFYHGCAAALARTVRRLWPNRQHYITLYSMRHQFSANAKASGFSREEVAAMMGHAVDTTAGEHYGRKTAGFDMTRVRPDPKDVAKVRTVFRSRFAAPRPEAR